MRRSSLRTAILAGSILSLLPLACSREQPPPAPPPPRAELPEEPLAAVRASLPAHAELNVLVVSIDALRADALGIHGGPEGVTPNLDRLAQESLVFERAHSVSPVTPTSFAAMFTGLLPSRVFHAWKLVHRDTLAARFREADYATAAFLNNVNLTPAQNFFVGFEQAYHGQNEPDAEIAREALDWLEDHRGDPFFAWVHLLGPHAPYDKQDEAGSLYDASYRGEFDLTSGAEFAPEDPADVARLRSLYHGEVHAVDRVFGDLYAGLEKLGLLRNTLLVVTSDHGEAFGEQGAFQHGRLYEPDVRIPLLIRHPDVRAGHRTQLLASNLDLFPTLLAVAGIESDARLDGVDLSHVEREPDTLVGVSMTGSNEYGRWLSIRRGPHKLIRTCVPEEGIELYDLEADPGEARNRADDEPQRAAELDRGLQLLVGGEDAPCFAMERAIGTSAPEVGLSEQAVALLHAPDYPEDLGPFWENVRLSTRAARNHQKVLLLGLDGITFRVLDPLFEAGRLPNLAKLVKDGIRAELWADAPLVSPAIWTEIATGRPRSETGITGHTVKLVGQAGVTPVVSSLRRTRALWNILDDWDKRSGVTGYLVTYPCEVFAGWCISYQPATWDADCFEPDTIHYLLEEHLKPAVKEVRPYLRKLADWPDTADYEKYHHETVEFRVGRALHRVRRDLQTTLWVLRTSQELLASDVPDLTVFYTHVTDEAGHLFWRYFEPEAFEDPVDPHELEALRNALPGTYEFADFVLGELLESLGPDPNVIVVSDHGMRADPNPIVAFGTNPLLEALGWLTYEERERGEKVVDYAKTKVYDQTEFFAQERGLFVNLEGREAKGIVPPAEFEALRAQVVEALSALTTSSGKPVYTSVTGTTSTDVRGVQSYDVTLVANTALDRNDEIVLADGRTLSVARLFWSTGTSGNHEPNGVLLAAGPAFAKGATLEKPSVLDVAPTVLTLLGVPVSEEMAGRVWTEALDPGFLSEFPVGTIASHEEPAVRAEGPVEGIRDEESLEERMQRLRDLGYIMDDAPAPPPESPPAPPEAP